LGTGTRPAAVACGFAKPKGFISQNLRSYNELIEGTRMFTAPDIRNYAQRQPFAPFRIVTTDGKSFDVLHPDLIMVGARDVTVGHPSRKHPGIYDGLSRVAILHITTIEDLPAGAPRPDADSNGSH
jgi:hypothetical protein